MALIEVGLARQRDGLDVLGVRILVLGAGRQPGGRELLAPSRMSFLRAIDTWRAMAVVERAFQTASGFFSSTSTKREFSISVKRIAESRELPGKLRRKLGRRCSWMNR